jgi:DNA-binding NarL/FixJ family response regulator
VPDQQTAVVADEWPLVRLGIAQALRARGVRVLAEEAQGLVAVAKARAAVATYLVLGAIRDASMADVVGQATSGEPRLQVIALLDQATRVELAAVAGAGARALLVRSVTPEELAASLDRVDKGERVISPTLLPLLVGQLGPPAEAEQAAATSGLTRREVEVLAQLAAGGSNREIAEALFVTEATVKTHLAHIYFKLGVVDRQGALARGVALGLLG